MTILVREQTARITFDVPAFIGTTGDPSGFYPDIGTQDLTFSFAPKKGEPGTLVFDHADPTKRTPTSAKFFHYHWKDNKLVVTEGFWPSFFFDCNLRFDKILGLVFEHSFGTYYTSSYSQGAYRKRVHVIDLLCHLEGKISLEELKAKVIQE